MVSFESDYITGAHPKILERLLATNTEVASGYGEDRFSQSAKEKIRAAFACPDAEVAFLTGGTQTNQFVIDTFLAPYEGVIAATTGHVSLHEAGAIEYTGHKVIELPGQNGKLSADTVCSFLRDFFADGNCEHMVQPGMVYISFPTEYGTIYSKEEMRALHELCQSYRIPLFVDGARLGYGLCSLSCDIEPQEFASLCDIFYIGGTKVGAFCGEAVVYCGVPMPKHFTTRLKSHGALLAKGRLNGIQFDTLFTDGLYFEIGRHAIELAEQMKKMLASKGIRFFLDSPTNQQFIVLENSLYRALAEHVAMGFWEKYDDHHTVLRLATTWSTTEADLAELERYLSLLTQ